MKQITISLAINLPDWAYIALKRLRDSLLPHRSQLNLRGDREIEWSWIISHMPSGPGNALDFGSSESFMGLISALQNYSVTAIDLTPVYWNYIHPGLTFLQGDILTLSLPEDHFDLIINCSTVEHVGLAGRYSIMEGRQDGDFEAMVRLRELMKPNAAMLLTIPVGIDEIFLPLCRVYGKQRLPQLLQGYVIERQTYWAKNPDNQWVECDQETALSVKASAGSADPLKSFYALGCFVLRKPTQATSQQG